MQAAARSVAHLRGKELDAAIASLGIVDVVERIALKHSLTASGEMQTDEILIGGQLRTDRYQPGSGGPAPSPISPEQRRLLARAGISLTARQSVSMIDMLLRPLNLDPETRIALKASLGEAGLLLPDQALPVTATPRKTFKAEADVAEKRTYTLAELEQWFNDLDVDASTRLLIKAKLLKAGRLTPGHKTPDLKASAKPGRTCRSMTICSSDFDALRR